MAEVPKKYEEIEVRLRRSDVTPFRVGPNHEVILTKTELSALLAKNLRDPCLPEETEMIRLRVEYDS